MTTTASIAHLEHAAQLKAVASDFKHEFHQQNNTLPGSAVPKGSAPHLADQAFSQYVDAVSKKTGLSKQAIMSVRESGIPRGSTDARAVEGLIDQDARERSAWESQKLGGRVKGGVAAEMQSAAARLHAAIDQASTLGVGVTADSTNATSNINGAAPSTTITETVHADTLIKHAADVKNVASNVKSQYPTTGSVVPRRSAPQHADQALAHVAEVVAQETTLSKQEVLGIPKGFGEKLPIEEVGKEIKEDASALAKEESVERLVARGGAAANMQSAATKLSQVQRVNNQ